MSHGDDDGMSALFTASATPYVQPGTVGYLGSMSALTPYSPPGSGLPGAGNTPGAGWTWQSYGIRNDNATLSLDHVIIYGGLQTGCTSFTMTNSVMMGGLSWFVFYATNVAGATLNFTNTTLSWWNVNVYPTGFDVATIHDSSGLCTYNVNRCDLSGLPQGLNPGPGSQVTNNYIHGLVQNSTDPNNPTHLDGVFNQGCNNVLLQGNFIDAGPYTTVAPPTACLFFQNIGGPSPITGLTVDSNFLYGGGRNFFNEDATGIVVTNNVFGGGYTFSAATNTGIGTIGTWSNNTTPQGVIVPSP